MKWYEINDTDNQYEREMILFTLCNAEKFEELPSQTTTTPQKTADRYCLSRDCKWCSLGARFQISL